MIAIQAALAVAYAALAHAASATRDDLYALGALLALVLMLVLPGMAARRAWAWLALPVLVAASWATYASGHGALPLLLVPIVFVAGIGWVFGRSLASPRGPLITRIVAAMEGVSWPEVAPELKTYTRRLTAAWAWLLAALAVANLALALVATPDGLLASVGVQPPLAITRTQWSWFANLLNYGIVGGFFFGEYQMRKRWFPMRYRNFPDFVRQLAALGPAFWKDFLR